MLQLGSQQGLALDRFLQIREGPQFVGDIPGDRQQMGRLVVTSRNREHLHIPIPGHPFRSIGVTCEPRPTTLHRRFDGIDGIEVIRSVPQFRPRYPLTLAKSSISMARRPLPLMNCRRPSRSRIVMQSATAREDAVQEFVISVQVQPCKHIVHRRHRRCRFAWRRRSRPSKATTPRLPGSRRETLA